MNNTNSLISIILPMYNEEQTIHEMILCLTKQTYHNFEALIIDDGSTDKSLAIAEEYAKQDPRLKVFSIPHGGVAKARNHGLRNMQGEYFCFVDADDLIKPEYIEVLYQGFVQNPQVDLSICNCTLRRTEDNTEINHIVHLKENPPVGNIFTDFINLRLLSIFMVCKMYRTSQQRKYQIYFDETMPIAEDQFFNRAYYDTITTYTYNDKLLYIYRIHSDSLSQNNTHYYEYDIANIRAYVAFINRHQIYWSLRERRASQKAFIRKYFTKKTSYNRHKKIFYEISLALDIKAYDFMALIMYCKTYFRVLKNFFK